MSYFYFVLLFLLKIYTLKTPSVFQAQGLTCTTKKCWLRELGFVVIVIQLYAGEGMPSVDYALKCEADVRKNPPQTAELLF